MGWSVPHEYERYQWLVHEWDVAKAWEMVGGREPDSVNVEEAIEAWQMATANLLFARAFDREWAETSDEIDLERPLLAAPYLWQNDEGEERRTLMLLDGAHRLWRAHVDGVEELPCIVLTDEESEAVHENLLTGEPMKDA